jgi:hypothetical protein
MSPQKRSKARVSSLHPGSGQKLAKSTVTPTGDQARLNYSFQYADRAYDGEWHWPPRGDDATEVFEFLTEMSQLTWREIRSQMTSGGKTGPQHKRHHFQAFDSVCSDAQKRIAELRLDEVAEELFRFRVRGERRLWGCVTENVFHVVWWDPNHQVYPTER